VLLVVAKGYEVLLHRLVRPLGFAVWLRVEDGPETEIETDVGANRVPKWTGKLFAVGTNIPLSLVRVPAIDLH